MDKATCGSLNDIYHDIWSNKYSQATEKLDPLLKKHPVFSLLHCEVSNFQYFIFFLLFLSFYRLV